MRARRIAGPPGGSMVKVGVDALAEFTTAPRSRIPVEDPQHVPRFGGPGAERVQVVQFQRVLRVPGKYDAEKPVLVEPLEQLRKRSGRLRRRRGGPGPIDRA